MDEESAEICRRNGWAPGTVLEGDEGYGPTRIRITAVGERSILAVAENGRESNWTLAYRDWKEVPQE